MKIQLQYIYFNPPAGGVENYFRAAGEYFSSQGDQVSVFCSQHPDIPAPPREEVGSLWVQRHPYYSPGRLLQPFKPLCYIRYLKEIIGKNCGEVDLFISRHPYYARAAKLAFPGKPLTFLPPDLRTRRLREQLGGSLKDRAFYYLARPQIDMIERGAVLSSDRVITLSLNLKSQFERYHRIPSNLIEVIPPGVDTGRFYPREPEPRVLSELDIDAGEKIILTVSRLSPEKNLPLLLRAFSLLELRSSRLLIVGDGDERGHLEELAGQLGISPWVCFAGSRNDLEKIYPLASVFVLPSTEEPFGQVYLEAMASGLPSIGLKGDPPRTLVATEEIITDGDDGFIVEPDNPGILARQIDLLLGNEALSKRMGEAALKKCREKFSRDTHFHLIFSKKK
ncbi:MAG: glycosyltransferase family 4 protein [Candidatus Auribacterota bacterium]|nr:glycosyltransferase family 4 protein [Candidatus Auribacterota bacterium]